MLYGLYVCVHWHPKEKLPRSLRSPPRPPEFQWSPLHWRPHETCICPPKRKPGRHSAAMPCHVLLVGRAWLVGHWWLVVVCDGWWLMVVTVGLMLVDHWLVGCCLMLVLVFDDYWWWRWWLLTVGKCCITKWTINNCSYQWYCWLLSTFAKRSLWYLMLSWLG